MGFNKCEWERIARTKVKNDKGSGLNSLRYEISELAKQDSNKGMAYMISN